MGLSQALSTAMSGLRANQAALALVSSNVSNAETPGYVRKTAAQSQTVAGVQVTGINRVLDQYIQTQLLTETSGASYANVRANTLGNLQSIYGDPSSSNTLESAFNTLTAALQGLSTSPESPSSRTAVLNAAQAMAQQLNMTSQGIQGLRTNAETGLANAVSTANNALAQIARINGQLQSLKPSDGSAAALMDQRDQYVSQLSQLMDIRVSNEGNQISVFTGSGFQLVTGVTAGTLSFNAQGAVTPNAQWNADPTKSGLSSVMLDLPNGGSIDLTAANAIRSGSIAAYLELRDHSLVQAQAQVDQLAAAMASALSDKTTSTPATSGTQNGFSFDLSAPQNGNTIRISYTDQAGQTHNVSVVLVDDPSVLPLKNTDIANSSDEVIGVDFSGGAASVAAQLNAAFSGSNLQFSASGGTLTVLDDGSGGLPTIQSGTLTQTVGSLTSGEAQLPFFLDGNSLYTGAMTATGSQQTGLAARITINPALLADSSRLIAYGASTPSGDTTRVDFISARLTSGTYTYSSATGVGSASSPFKGTLLNYTQQFLGIQANAASSAQALSDGQDIVLATLQKKMDSISGVDIDEEMANLLALQNAYAANARVMSTVNSMFQALMQVL
jgi:flagellar hook-associated protein 1 FlgK